MYFKLGVTTSSSCSSFLFSGIAGSNQVHQLFARTRQATKFQRDSTKNLYSNAEHSDIDFNSTIEPGRRVSTISEAFLRQTISEENLSEEDEISTIDSRKDTCSEAGSKKNTSDCPLQWKLRVQKLFGDFEPPGFQQNNVDDDVHQIALRRVYLK